MIEGGKTYDFDDKVPSIQKYDPKNKNDFDNLLKLNGQTDKEGTSQHTIVAVFKDQIIACCSLKIATLNIKDLDHKKYADEDFRHE